MPKSTAAQNSTKNAFTNLSFFQKIFIFFLLLYLLSFFMPATLVDSNKTFLGWDAASSATIFMGSSIGNFIGGLANFILLLILLVRILIFYQEDKTPKIIMATSLHGLLTLIAFLSVGIWLVIWTQPLLIGYYCWAISTIGLCLSNFLYQRLTNAALLNKQENKELLDHIIEE